MRRALSLVFLATALVGCASRTPEPPKVPLSQSASEAALPSAQAGEPLFGTVLEQLSAPPYIYLRLRTSKGEVWAAVPAAVVAIGAEVKLGNPMLMANFESTSLKRTFPEVYVGTLAQAGAVATGMPAAAGSSDNPHAGGSMPTAAVMVGKVEKAAGADAHTISEVWKQKAGLLGKTVSIRGVVVKSNDGVMGKNWIHLQDGSGDAKSATNDITVTSLDRAAVGETVTITGTVRTNKDFGMGYTYAVIVEEAKIAKR